MHYYFAIHSVFGDACICAWLAALKLQESITLSIEDVGIAIRTLVSFYTLMK